MINDFINYIEDYEDTSFTVFDYDRDIRFHIPFLTDFAIELLDSTMMIHDLSGEMNTLRIAYNDIMEIVYQESYRPSKSIFFYENQDAYIVK